MKLKKCESWKRLFSYFRRKTSCLIFFLLQGIFTAVPEKERPLGGILSGSSSSIGLTKPVPGVPCYHVKFLFIRLGVFRGFYDVCGNAFTGCLS